MSKSNGRAVVVCTDKRGVFFGYGDPQPGADPITLERARMCVRWTDTRGVLGLAADGPNKKCRITAAVPRVELRGVTAVIECSPEAADAWEQAPWMA